MSKVVLVTGGSSGIGMAIAKYLSDKNYIVYGTSRYCEEGEHNGFFNLKMDVTDEASISRVANQIHEKHGRIDVLVNNAGLGMVGPLESTTDQESRKVFDTNVFGVLNTCRCFVPYLRASAGRVINITSLGGVFGLPYRGVYCSSKFAVEGISETMSMELRRAGVWVSIIQPGDFKTNINANRLNAGMVDDKLYPDFKEVHERINNDVKYAKDPMMIARKVDKIICATKPRLRYRVATPLQRMSVVLHRVLPGRLYEKMLMRHYGLR